VPPYAWRCRYCGETLNADPRYWPVVEDFHRLIHRLEARVADLTLRLGVHP
jgi:hypothetical protein